MSYTIKLYNINAPRNFSLSYKTGLTLNGDGNFTTYNYTSNVGNLYYKSTTGATSGVLRNYIDTDPIPFTGASENTQYWFKMQYTGDTGDIVYSPMHL